MRAPDQDALITDFVALGFLPPGSDRRRIIPVMDAVLSPYLRGGGARSFNFQVHADLCLTLPADADMLSAWQALSRHPEGEKACAESE